MDNIQIGFIVFIAIFVVIGLYWLKCRIEGFTNEFESANVSTEFLQSIDMGDHRTVARLQRGNSGKTVLLLHNSPMNLNVWSPLYQTMQRISMSGVKTPNLVTFDIRGHGTAWMPVDPKFNDLDVNNHAWPIELFVQDTKKIYDTIIGSGKVIVCGFGFGGYIAQKYALKYPEQVEKLVLLQTTIEPSPGLDEEIKYLAGPDGWIAKNPHIYYLTGEEKFVKKTLCDWFYLPPSERCEQNPLLGNNSDFNDELAPQFNLTAKMWRQGSSTTTLQTDKIAASINLVKEWQDAKDIGFTIHILSGTDDPYAPPNQIMQSYTIMNNVNRSLLVVLDIVKGRHGFAIMRPDYIAGIICDDCEQLGTEDALSPHHTF